MQCLYCGVTTEKTTGVCNHCGAPLPNFSMESAGNKFDAATAEWVKFMNSLGTATHPQYYVRGITIGTAIPYGERIESGE